MIKKGDLVNVRNDNPNVTVQYRPFIGVVLARRLVTKPRAFCNRKDRGAYNFAVLPLSHGSGLSMDRGAWVTGNNVHPPSCRCKICARLRD